MQHLPKAVVICSGGLDSTVLLYRTKLLDYEPFVLSFDYGQRHARELDYAARTCGKLVCDWHLVDLTSCTKLLATSALTQYSQSVPEGHYAADTMKATVVPNRNAIMLSIAYGYAVSIGAKVVLFGAHSGDHAIYPDCRPEFVQFLSSVLQSGNEWADPLPQIEAPFVTMTKADIVSLGATLQVPFEETWSCYKGGQLHCGRCGTCVERAEAFHLAGVADPTEYADAEFWKQATQHA